MIDPANNFSLFNIMWKSKKEIQCNPFLNWFKNWNIKLKTNLRDINWESMQTFECLVWIKETWWRINMKLKHILKVIYQFLYLVEKEMLLLNTDLILKKSVDKLVKFEMKEFEIKFLWRSFLYWMVKNLAEFFIKFSMRFSRNLKIKGEILGFRSHGVPSLEILWWLK